MMKQYSLGLEVFQLVFTVNFSFEVYCLLGHMAVLSIED
jgi:hypothetical protein